MTDYGDVVVVVVETGVSVVVAGVVVVVVVTTGVVVVVVVATEVVVVCDGSLFRYFCISKLSQERVSLSSVPVLAFTAVPFRSCRVMVTACAQVFNRLSTELP
jgi:hypothetical protein